MRIVKLSSSPPAGFTTHADVRRFFINEIHNREDSGRFNLTFGRIGPGQLAPSEILIFTFQKRLAFIARSASELLRNANPRNRSYPNYFQIDLNTIHELDISYQQFEQLYSKTTGKHCLISGRGWNHIPESSNNNAFWNKLVELSEEDFFLNAEQAYESDDTNEEIYIPVTHDNRKLVQKIIRQRRGTKKFRNSLRKRYGNRCVVTGCKLISILEAAHINPYRGEADNHAANGLLLRADIHTLFDLDLLTINPDSMCVELNPQLINEQDYKHLNKKSLKWENKKSPSIPALKIRYELFLRRLNQAT